jgi:uncharacterized surface protein with fasciclin (FAS1) repeats
MPLAAISLSAEAGTGKTIVDTAKEAGSFNILLQAAAAAGLVDKLSGDGPFTVFAPTDNAFAQLPEGKLDMLLKPENKDKLAEILTFHVVPDEVTADDMAGEMKELETVQGGLIEINSAGRITKVAHAAVIQPDIEASNGVIHVIDQVILPN